MDYSIEARIKDEKYWKIGWAIANMTPIQKILWAITGNINS